MGLLAGMLAAILAFPVMALAEDRSCKNFDIAVTESWEPLSWKTASGELDGIVPRLLKEVGNNTGLAFVHITNLPWKRQLYMLQKGQLAAMAAMHFNEERAEKYVLSEPYFHNDIHVFRHRDSDLEYTELADLKDRLGVLPLGGSFGSAFDQYRQQHLNMEERGSVPEILRMVLSRHAEFFILPKYLGNYAIRTEGARDVIQLSGPPVATKPVHMALSRNHVCGQQISIINDEISRLKKIGWFKTVTRQVEEQLTN